MIYFLRHSELPLFQDTFEIVSITNQVGAKMGKSTRPVYWGRSVITVHTVVGDMLEWALWVTPIQ